METCRARGRLKRRSGEDRFDRLPSLNSGA